MKKILTLIAVFAILTSYSQDCEVTAVGLSYVVPKGASIEIMKADKFQVSGGIVYQRLKVPITKNEDPQKHSVNVLANAGYRIIHIDYKLAVYANIGFMMGNIDQLRLYNSLKIMLLANQKAYSLEPFYSKKPGLKLSYFIRI